MNYDETQQKLLLREMEGDLLAIVAVDMGSDEFEVVYTDGAYREYANRHRGEHFFDSWQRIGLSLVYGPDRGRMGAELAKANLEQQLASNATYTTIARFIGGGAPRWCRIKAARDVPEPGVVTLSFRDVEREVRHELAHGRELEAARRRLAAVQQRIRCLTGEGSRRIRVNALGRFTLLVDGKPVPLQGKPKEILALLVSRRGKEVGNEEAYRIIWEGRGDDRRSKTVYFNALHRLKEALASADASEILVKAPHGYLVDVACFDCDYYEWLDDAANEGRPLPGELLEEYSWAEPLKGRASIPHDG